MLILKGIEKRGGLTVVSLDRSRFKLFYSGNIQTNLCRPHPVGGKKVLSVPPYFYYLQTIIVFHYRHSVGVRHTFHIIH
jgi:hypothetical protein